MPTRKRVKRDDNLAESVSVVIPQSSSFSGLPFDIKYHIARSCQLSPSDLLSLSHVNQSWRQTAADQTLYSEWFQAFPEKIREQLTRIFGGFNKRTFVHVALGSRCQAPGCGARAADISCTLLIRLCQRCIIDNPLYHCVEAKLRVQYGLTPKDLEKLVRCSSGVDKDGKRNAEFQWHWYSREEMKALAIKKHGGTLEALTAFMAPKIAAATRKYELQMIRYKKAASAYDTDFWQPATKPPGAPRKPNGYEKDQAKAEASYQKRLSAHERSLKDFDMGLVPRKRPRKPSGSVIVQGDRADCYLDMMGYILTHVQIGYLFYNPRSCSMKHYSPRACIICNKLLDIPRSIDYDFMQLQFKYKEMKLYLPRRKCPELRRHMKEIHVEPYVSPTPCPATCINSASSVMAPDNDMPQTTTQQPCEQCREREIIGQEMGDDWLEHEISWIRADRDEEDWLLPCCFEGTCQYSETD